MNKKSKLTVFLCLFLCIMMAAGCMPVQSVKADEPTDVWYGDVNDDGKVDAKDVTMLRRQLAGGWNVNINEEKADLNQDDEINAKDVTMLRRYLAGGWGVKLLDKTNVSSNDIDSIIASLGLNVDSPTLLKVRKVHDWMVFNITYDGLWLKQIREKRTDSHGRKYGIDIRDASSDSPSYPVWVLENKLAICSGYANLFKLFMDRLGVSCKYVSGIAGGDGHAWNLVLMDDGCWYHVDVTWDDKGAPDEWQRGCYDTNYLLIDDECISKDHFDWEDSFDYIKADGVYYNEIINHYVGFDCDDACSIEYDDEGYLVKILHTDSYTKCIYTDIYENELLVKRLIENINTKVIENREYTYYNNRKMKSERKSYSDSEQIYITYYDETGYTVVKGENILGGEVIWQVVYEYYDNGKKKIEIQTDADGDVTSTYYNEKGDMTGTIYQNAQGDTIQKYEYERYDNGITKICIYTNSNGDVETTFFNESGKAIERVCKDAHGVIKSQYEYEYHDNGIVKKAVYKKSNGDIETTNFNESGKAIDKVCRDSQGAIKSQYEYYENGNKKMEKVFNSNGEVTTRYLNESGKTYMLKKLDGIDTEKVIEYDENGDIFRETTTNTETGEKYSWEYERYENGYKKKSIKKNDEGEIIIILEYDEKGYLINEIYSN